MKLRYVAASGAVALTLFALSLSAQKTPAPKRLRLDAHRTLGTPRAFRGLTLIPVYDMAARPDDAYVTLDEGLKAKTVSVTEAKDGAQVNTLFLSNTGKKPLYIMGGEVVLGGQQDRMLSRDIIVPSGATRLPITVFCVEHGRWTGQRQFGESAKMIASASIRADAQNGAFYADRAAARPDSIASARIDADAPISAPSAPTTRGASRGQRQPANVPTGSSVGESQQKVWDKVAAKNGNFKTAPITGTYRGVLNMTGGDAQRNVAPYLKAFSGPLDSDTHLVGMITAVNGKVVASDIFSDPALFRKLWPKLLRSYAADAAENAPVSARKPPVVTAQAAKAFLIAARDAKSKAINQSSVSATERLESPLATAYIFEAHRKAGSAKPGDAKTNSALHESVLRK